MTDVYIGPEISSEDTYKNLNMKPEVHDAVSSETEVEEERMQAKDLVNTCVKPRTRKGRGPVGPRGPRGSADSADMVVGKSCRGAFWPLRSECACQRRSLPSYPTACTSLWVTT